MNTSTRMNKMREFPPENGMRVFAVGEYGSDGYVANEWLVTSCRLQETPGHDIVHVWNRGGKAGTLAVNKGDGEALIYRIFNATPRPANV